MRLPKQTGGRTQKAEDERRQGNELRQLQQLLGDMERKNATLEQMVKLFTGFLLHRSSNISL